MKIKIKGKGNTPCAGGWSVQDENGVDLQVESIKIDAHSEKATVELRLFDVGSIDIEANADVVCDHAALFYVHRHGKRFGLCTAHANAVRYLQSKGVFFTDRCFDVEVFEPGPQYWKCGDVVL